MRAAQAIRRCAVALNGRPFATTGNHPMPPELNFDLAKIDFSHVLADREAIRKVNPQRFEMEQLDAVVHLDPREKIIVGYKDVRDDEFWVRGHMPGYPLLPGVLMCEASAQLCVYYSTTQRVVDAELLGFAGMENVRFRNQVRPGDRLVLVAKGTKFHRRQIIFNVQGFVAGTMVFHADIIGMPIRRKEE
jgi:3-hydroxyacyl-[acyl-carrier-protein] dehydratase